MNIQALRDSFLPGEEVQVAFRGYNGGPSNIRTGRIVDKEAAFATVRFDHKTQKVPYTRLQRMRESAAAPASEPPKQPTLLRVVPQSFRHLQDVIDVEAEPVHEPPSAPTAPAPSLPGSDDVSVWLEMGASLLPTLRASRERLLVEAAELAEQAQQLVDASDRKTAEAEQVAKHIALLERLHA